MGAAFWNEQMVRAWIVLAALALAACSRSAEEVRLTGYVEAELLYLAPRETGVIAELLVREGDAVEKGAPLFRLETDQSALSVDQGSLEAQAATARAADAGALIRAVEEAEAQADIARRELARSSALKKEGFATGELVDRDRAALDAANARLDRARAERDEAAMHADAALAELALREQRLADLSVAAPTAGAVDRIFRRVGEIAAPGEPVLALRPPGAVKLRFFVPQSNLSTLAVGAPVSFTCDHCPSGLTARISFIAAEPQFTPPVIYSLEEREKLVFLIEARPEPGAPPLAPGLPVDVILP